MDNGVSAGSVVIQAGSFKLVVSGTVPSGASIGLEMQAPDGGFAEVNRLAAAAAISITPSTAGTEDCLLPQGVVRLVTAGTTTGLYVYLIRI